MYLFIVLLKMLSFELVSQVTSLNPNCRITRVTRTISVTLYISANSTTNRSLIAVCLRDALLMVFMLIGVGVLH